MLKNKEIWRDVKGFEGLYQVSDKGRVKSLERTFIDKIGRNTTDYKLVKVWQSTREVKSNLGFDRGNISKAALGKYKTAYGYVWKYIEEKIN